MAPTPAPPRVILRGGLWAALIAGAAGIAQALTSAAPLRGLLFAIIVGGFVFGGFVAAREVAASLAKVGALSAATGFAIVQGLATARRAIAGEPIALGAIILGALTAAVCGSIGGLLAARARRARP